MKNRIKWTAYAFIAASSVTLHAQLKTNAGLQYLLSQTKDMSQDFLDLSNTYFFADSLVSIDNQTGQGVVKWKRHQLMPRQAFNANTFLHQPLQNLDFPDTAYDNDPQLSFSVEPINDRTLRIRMLTTPVTPKEEESIMLVGKPSDGRSEWKVTQSAEGTTYTSEHGSLTINNYPWME